MKATYEWDIETVETYGDEDTNDVYDHNHSDSLDYRIDELTDALNEVLEGTKFTRLVLVCDDHSGRSWAYLDSEGNLPTHFACAYGEDTRRVPVRFKNELTRIKDKISNELRNL